jgi:hypothetical protein
MAYQPKSYKKFVATAATATLVASAVVPTALAATAFTDVSSNYTEAVDYLVTEKITEGISETLFGTTTNIKRGDAAIFIAKALGLDTVNAPDADFTDVNSRVEGAVNAIVAAKIASGKTESTFAPDDYITRAEMAKILVNAYELKAGDTENTFTDVNSTWDGYVDALVASGVTLGLTETTFGATENVTRGQFALFIFRAENPVITVTSATATDANTLSVVLSDGTTNVVTLPTALEANKATAVTFTIDGKEYKATVTYVVTSPEVVSVSAINATQVEVKFSTPVTASSVIASSPATSPEVAGTLVDGVFTFSTLDGKAVTANTATAKLSDDKKTLTITTVSPQVFEERYDVTIDGAKDANGKAVAKFVKVIDFNKDITAPTITSTEKVSANLVKVSFSEPLSTLGTVTFALENGKTVTGITQSTAFAAGASSVTYDLSAALVDGSALATGVNVSATFVGAQDQKLNLLSPNPAKVTFTKGAKDGVAPTVSTVTQTGAKELAVKFSEELITNPTISINGAAIATANVVKDKNDATKYIVTTPVLDGATTVAVTPFTDLSGEVGSTFSKVYTFVKDVVAAKVLSTNVVQDSTDGKQYLEFTFDKDVELVTPTVNVKGTQVEDFVTVPVDKTATVSYKSTSSDKVIRVALSTLLANPSATYNVGAVYDLDATFAGVTSKTGVAVDSSTADFTLVADGSASVSDKVKVSTVAQGGSNNLVTVTFDATVDLATATTASNYTVDGAIVESATASSATTNAITLTLKDNSNTFTGIRNVTVKNVKKLNGTVAMDTQTIVSTSLNENVVPTISSAALTATNTIKVTFSENVKNGAAADFVLYVGGEAVTANTVTTATQATATDNVLELTLVTPVTATDITKGLSIKAASTVDVTDSADNKVSVPTAVNVAQ